MWRGKQAKLYTETVETYGPALGRLARAYEADADARQDLLQEIHLALWRSMAGFDNRCSLRTWVYRVAHNAATSHVMRSKRAKAQTRVSLEEIDEQGAPAPANRSDSALDKAQMLDRLYALIYSLNPKDLLEKSSRVSRGRNCGVRIRVLHLQIP